MLLIGLLGLLIMLLGLLLGMLELLMLLLGLLMLLGLLRLLLGPEGHLTLLHWLLRRWKILDNCSTRLTAAINVDREPEGHYNNT
jgi:hypothetical protein